MVGDEWFARGRIPSLFLFFSVPPFRARIHRRVGIATAESSFNGNNLARDSSRYRSTLFRLRRIDTE